MLILYYMVLLFNLFLTIKICRTKIRKAGITMIKDRGNIKWSSLMLTEHRQKLEELYDNDSNIPRPELDEHQLNQMNNILKQALAHDKNIKLKYYKNNKIENYIGEIIKYRAQDRALLLKVNEKNLSFQLKNIIEITF